MKFVEDLYSYEKRKWNLLESYDSFSLEEVLNGRVSKNRHGDFYLLEDGINFEREAYLKDTNSLDSELRLVRGIGEKRERELEEKGVKDLYDLIEEERYLKDGQEFMKEINDGEYYTIYQRIQKNLPRSDRIYLSLISSIGLEEILIFDVESLGFTGDPIFLIGTATFDGDKLLTKQFLARNKDEEKNILREFEKDMDDNLALVSFNGRRFDENLIKQRANRYDLEISFSIPHIDFLHIAKELWKDRCENFKLSTLESEILKIEREKDLPGILIPHFYQSYLERENPGPLIPVLEHNKRDLLSIARLFKYL